MASIEQTQKAQDKRIKEFYRYGLRAKKSGYLGRLEFCATDCERILKTIRKFIKYEEANKDIL
jgi:hypothetical protein